jgi:hypothetical protein
MIGLAVSFVEVTLASKVLVICGFVIWGIVIMPICWALSYLRLPNFSRRLFHQQRSLRRPWTYRWSDFSIENEGESGITRLEWGELHAWARTKRFFLFYVNDQLYHMLPLRVLDGRQTDDLERLLCKHGPQRR